MSTCKLFHQPFLFGVTQSYPEAYSPLPITKWGSLFLALPWFPSHVNQGEWRGWPHTAERPKLIQKDSREATQQVQAKGKIHLIPHPLLALSWEPVPEPYQTKKIVIITPVVRLPLYHPTPISPHPAHPIMVKFKI